MSRESGEFALVPDDGAGSLPVDRYRAHFVNVPPHYSESYRLVRFYFPEENGEELLPKKAPASWVREVSDPLELGAVWFATTCRARCTKLKTPTAGRCGSSWNSKSSSATSTGRLRPAPALPSTRGSRSHPTSRLRRAALAG